MLDLGHPMTSSLTGYTCNDPVSRRQSFPEQDEDHTIFQWLDLSCIANSLPVL